MVSISKIKTLHELLAIALDDLSKIEVDSRYEVNMAEWHRPKNNGICEVCLAGSVMAKSLGASLSTFSIPCDYNAKVAQRLRALDSLRSGKLRYAIEYFYSMTSNRFSDDIVVPEYDLYPEEWWKTIKEILEILKKENL